MREESFGFIFRLALFICYCIFWSKGGEDGKNRQTFVIRYKDEDQTIPVTVVLDYKKQTEYVINMNPRTPAKSVTLYDFKQRTIAYKDLTNNECFLGRLTHETLSEESNALQDVKNPVEVKPKIRSLDPKTPALTPTEIRNIAGQKTAAFCRKMNTWLLMPERIHNITKREADEEFEERTLQYHGHRSSQYSHYERETRRRFRNRSQAHHRRRSRTKESAAENENASLEVLESDISPHLINSQSSNNVQFNPEHFSSSTDKNNEKHSHNYNLFQNPLPIIEENVDKKENVDDGASFNNRVSSRNSNIKQNHFRYPISENGYSSTSTVSNYSRPHYFNSDDSGTISLFDQEIISDPTKNPLRPLKENGFSARLKSGDNSDEIQIKSVTTVSPDTFYEQRGSHPTVHSSLLHLLPLYKPLGREFDFNEETGAGLSSNQEPTNKQREIESELHNSSTDDIDNKFIHLTHEYNTSYDPDVSVNILEVPKITKEFENIQNNGTYYPASFTGNSINSQEGRLPNVINTHLGHVPKFTNVNSINETHFNKNRNNLVRPFLFSTTEVPLVTTHDSSTPKRTTPETPYIPSVHTAFQNLEDFNSFQIFPNFIDNNNIPLSTETSLNVHFLDVDKISDNHAAGIPQDLISTTVHPLTGENKIANSNHEYDISNENSIAKSIAFSRTDSSAQKKSYSVDSSNITEEEFFPHKIRYQNALRDFKPDEILIDVENIPTNTPLPDTANFRQRFLTTIQPTVRILPTKGVKSDTFRRSEQTSVTSWRSLIPTTRFPRRRVSNKSRTPIQSSSDSFVHRSSTNQNRIPSHQLNQLVGVRRFNTIHHMNRHQFRYPSQPIPPSHISMPLDVNQLHHISHLNNLPPGVSVHPRHPQAPFADMVHSNRPPTIPILSDNQEYLKPHRQRHHKKKDRLLNSCCRLRGKSAAFQSCCRNGGPCCSRSHRLMQPPGCCSSSKVNRQIIPANQIQPNFRTSNKILPPIRTEEAHRSEVDNKDRCQKEKMCRTLYESTQRVMVCRNAQIEGC